MLLQRERETLRPAWVHRARVLPPRYGQRKCCAKEDVSNLLQVKERVDGHSTDYAMLGRGYCDD